MISLESGEPPPTYLEVSRSALHKQNRQAGMLRGREPTSLSDRDTLGPFVLAPAEQRVFPSFLRRTIDSEVFIGVLEDLPNTGSAADRPRQRVSQSSKEDSCDSWGNETRRSIRPSEC